MCKCAGPLTQREIDLAEDRCPGIGRHTSCGHVRESERPRVRDTLGMDASDDFTDVVGRIRHRSSAQTAFRGTDGTCTDGTCHGQNHHAERRDRQGPHCVLTASLVAPLVTPAGSLNRTKMRLCAGSNTTVPSPLMKIANVGVALASICVVTALVGAPRQAPLVGLV